MGQACGVPAATRRHRAYLHMERDIASRLVFLDLFIDLRMVSGERGINGKCLCKARLRDNAMDGSCGWLR